MEGKLLLIEDNRDLGQEIRNYLQAEGFDVTLVPSAFGATELCRINTYDLLIVDIQLPGEDGFKLIEKLRTQKEDARFIFLTARNSKESKLKGLKLGAEDYITKPFDIEELAWRINNILHRNSNFTKTKISVEDVELDTVSMELVIAHTKPHKLTVREYELWKYILDNKNNILKREDILTNVWGSNDYFLGRSLDVFISRIRKLLQHSKKLQLDTVFRVGFILKEKDSTSC